MARRGKKGVLFFNWGLVIIAFLTLSAAFVVLVVKHEDIAGDMDQIGRRQFELYNAYEDGEVLNEKMERAGDRAAERAAHILALSGGYIEETLSESECEPQVSGNGTPIWVNVDEKCYPDYLVGFMTYYDEAITEYFDAGAFPFGKPGYAHFLENEGSKTEKLEIISRALHHLTIDLEDRSIVTLTESDFDPNEEDVFAEAMRELQYAGSPTSSYFINVSAASEKLADIGDWNPNIYGQYSGLCHYCNKNKQLLKDYYPQEFEQVGCKLGTFNSPLCCEAPCPPGALVLEVPQYAQCGFSTVGTRTICYSGCGPTSTLMAVEAATGVSHSVYDIWDALGTSGDGTSRTQITNYLTSRDLYLASGMDLPLSDIGSHIAEGHPIIMNPLQQYNDERSCYSITCNGVTGGHYMVVVGITPNEELIIHDPYPGPGARSQGRNIVIRKETLQKLYAHDGRVGYIILKTNVDLTPAAQEPDYPTPTEPPADGSEVPE